MPQTQMFSQVRSSLAFQILLSINKYYSIFLSVLLFILFFYKGAVLPYPLHVRIMEFIIIILIFIPIEFVRLAWGARGNLTETPVFLVFSLLLGLASLSICVYEGLFQNYVLLLEEICLCIETVFILLHILLSTALVASFSRSQAVE